MDLRDYQSKLIEDFSEAIKSHQRVVVTAPTGSGKTIIAIYGLIPLLKGPIAWITHRRELLHQVAEHQSDVDIHMVQSSKIKRFYASIIIDEGHHSCAETYHMLFDKYPASQIVALTATPYRLDGIGLGSVGFTKIVHGPDIYDLTSRGYLCPCTIFVPKDETLGAWPPEAAAEKIAQSKFEKAIVYCREIDDANQIARLLNKRSISAETVNWATKRQARDATVRKYGIGKLRVICNHTIFTEGYDSPITDMVVLNRQTASRCLWKQMCGRVMRNHEGKTSGMILDLAGNSIFHGSIYDGEKYDLDGSVSEIIPQQEDRKDPVRGEYQYNEGRELKVWMPRGKPTIIRESLQKLRSHSPLRKLLIAS